MILEGYIFALCCLTAHFFASYANTVPCSLPRPPIGGKGGWKETRPSLHIFLNCRLLWIRVATTKLSATVYVKVKCIDFIKKIIWGHSFQFSKYDLQYKGNISWRFTTWLCVFREAPWTSKLLEANEILFVLLKLPVRKQCKKPWI